MAELNLLPAKEFEIILADGTVIPGKFGIWATHRFCEKRKLSLYEMVELMTGELVKDEEGNPVEIEVPDGKGGTVKQYATKSKMSIGDICLLILCAVEYKSRKDKKGFAFTDMDACEWIEELGGINSEKYNKLMNHAASELEPSGDDEKKSQ